MFGNKTCKLKKKWKKYYLSNRKNKYCETKKINKSIEKTLKTCYNITRKTCGRSKDVILMHVKIISFRFCVERRLILWRR